MGRLACNMLCRSASYPATHGPTMGRLSGGIAPPKGKQTNHNPEIALELLAWLAWSCFKSQHNVVCHITNS